ncbi:MAG: universal stress protein [Chitinophagaceae bacterium]
MRHILVPTDFTPASLKMVEQAVKTLDGQKLDIILFHAFELPFFVSDLVGSAKRQPYHDLVTDEFRSACKQLKDQFPRSIHRIQFRFMQGDTVALFRNFLDANEIDMIVCPEYYQYRKVHERSINPTTFFKKSGIPVLTELEPRRKEVTYTIQKEIEPALSFVRN